MTAGWSRGVAWLLAAGLACAPAAAPAPAPQPPRARAPDPAGGPAPAGRAAGGAAVERAVAEDMAADQARPWTAAWRLAWSDFQGTPPPGGPEGARTAYGLYYAWACRGDAFSYHVTAALHPRRSWVKTAVVRDARESARVLRHEQTHFDLTEVFARRLRRHFAELPRPCTRSDEELRGAARRIVEEEKAMQRRYDEETQHGLRDGPQATWNADVARMLAAAARDAL